MARHQVSSPVAKSSGVRGISHRARGIGDGDEVGRIGRKEEGGRIECGRQIKAGENRCTRFLLKVIVAGIGIQWQVKPSKLDRASDIRL